VLTTIDRNPEIITGLLATIDNTVSTVGNVANTALAPNGVVAQTVGTVGQIANTALQPGGVVTDLVNTVGSVANTALQPGGVVTDLVNTVGGVANTALAPNGVIAQTVGTVGGIANTALQPGGVVSQTVGTVGDIANNTVNTLGNVTNTALQPGGVVSQTIGTVGDVANNTIGTVNNVAGVALQPGGVVSQVTGAVGGAVQNLTGQGGLLSAQALSTLGQTAMRVVDASGQILQRTVDASGRIIDQTLVGTVLQLPTVSQSMGANGIIQRIVQDVSGALVLVNLDNVGRILGTQVLQRAASAAGAVAPQIIPPNRQPQEEQEDDGVMQQGSASPGGRRIGGPHVNEIDEDAYWAPVQQQVATPIPVSNAAPWQPPDVLVLAATIDDRGEMVQRVVDTEGTIIERTFHPATGALSLQKRVGTVMRLATLNQRVDPSGAITRMVREPTTGAILELTFNMTGKLSRIRLAQVGTMTSATMATASATANRSPASPPPTALPGTMAPPSPLPPNALPTGAVAALAGGAANPAHVATAPTTNVINIQSGLASLGDVPAAIRHTAVVDPDTTKQLLLLSQRLNDRGQIVVRVMDIDGKITERSLNAAGQLVVKKGAANARLLPLVREYVDAKGQYVRLVRDNYGAILELDFNPDGKLFRVRVLDRPDLDLTGAAAVASQLPSAVAQTVNNLGQMVQNVVLASGAIVQRLVDRSGQVLQQREVGSVLKLPALVALAQADGRLVVIARDPTGVLLEIIMRADTRTLLSVRTIAAAAAAPVSP
jgi:hypothetical protein